MPTLADIPALDDALDQLRHHRGVSRVGEPREFDGNVRVEIDITVALPSRARASGISASGVRATETCTLVFTPRWPLRAPRPYLRADFPLHLPHINPYTADHLVSPCVFEGSLDELLHRFGLDAIVDQLIEWLDNAASGTLIDLSQGWEPTRRDACASTVVFSAERLVATAPTDGSILATDAFYGTFREGIYAFLDATLTARPEQVFNQRHADNPPGTFATGRCAVFVTRAPFIDGQAPVVGSYQPDTVDSIDSLLAQANELGIDAVALGQALDGYYGRSILDLQEDPRGWTKGLFAIVVLAVQRPAALVGAHGRSVEVLPYVVRFDVDPTEVMKRTPSVHAAFHEHALSDELLARASGLAAPATSKKLVLLGCGSLGSKVGLHLGRAGFGQLTFVDKERLSPHNLARHGLIVDLEKKLLDSKAERMKTAFATLSHTGSRAFSEDAVEVFSDLARWAEVVPEDTALILDTTASLQVQAAAAVSQHLGAHRLARGALYGQGRCAVLMLEGPARGTRVDDLTATLFELCRYLPRLRAAVAGDSTEATRIFVGDNCRSLTMPMSDAKVSRAAAPMALQVERWLTDGLPSSSQLLIGLVDEAGLGMGWGAHSVAPVTVLEVKDDGGWQVRVLDPVARAIDADARLWDRFETGGALVGRISYESRTIIIAGMVGAPPDSVRSPSTFTLGTDGLVNDLKRAHADSLGYLTFLGTWHSHPMGGDHSGIDRDTLRKIASDAGGLPAASLVWTPTGLRCAVARW